MALDLSSARQQEVDDARAAGATLITAREVATDGIQSAIDAIPKGADLIITLDRDGLDPSVIQGVAGRAPANCRHDQFDIGHPQMRIAGGEVRDEVGFGQCRLRVAGTIGSVPVRVRRSRWARVRPLLVADVVALCAHALAAVMPDCCETHQDEFRRRFCGFWATA
jgi:hypothetical protein